MHVSGISTLTDRGKLRPVNIRLNFKMDDLEQREVIDKTFNKREDKIFVDLLEE